ncbi:hypothetical protein FGO68_gene14451 [Halteria grandinella]|uniref:Uncharacterized protein n=1 Tax=Halteria grandinella TaxID=5974 RepID=A0A8J8NJ96_HALGN|nr:hypothetical protein FGO68_gene14451 [Halteria grandinella]
MEKQIPQYTSTVANGYPAAQPQQTQFYPPLVGYENQNFPAQQFPNQFNQPMIPAGYINQQVAPSYEQIVNDPVFLLEKQLRCSRTVIIVFSIVTYFLFGAAFVHAFLDRYYGDFVSFYPIFLLLPHLCLALVAHTTIRKPIREQLMNGSGSTCSLILLALFSLFLIIAIVVIIWTTQELRYCYSESCGILESFLIFLGITPAMVWLLLWSLPCAYFSYKSKLEAGRRDQQLMQMVRGQNQ